MLGPKWETILLRGGDPDRGAEFQTVSLAAASPEGQAEGTEKRAILDTSPSRESDYRTYIRKQLLLNKQSTYTLKSGKFGTWRTTWRTTFDLGNLIVRGR